jgi:hypothetical protein
MCYPLLASPFPLKHWQHWRRPVTFPIRNTNGRRRLVRQHPESSLRSQRWLIALAASERHTREWELRRHHSPYPSRRRRTRPPPHLITPSRYTSPNQGNSNSGSDRRRARSQGATPIRGISETWTLRIV